MQLRFEMLSDDAVALAVHQLKTSKAHRPMRLALQWGLPVLTFAMIALTRPSLFGVAAGALFSVSYALRIPGVMQRRCADRAKKFVTQGEGKRALGPHVLKLEGAQASLEGPMGKAQFDPGTVEQVCDTEHHVFLHLPAGAILTIPKRTLEAHQVSDLLAAFQTPSSA